jgi:hypothetical protein
MAYGTDDYEVRTFWLETESNAQANVSIAGTWTGTPHDLRLHIEDKLNQTGGVTPCFLMNEHSLYNGADVFSLALGGSVESGGAGAFGGAASNGVLPVQSSFVFATLTTLPGRTHRGRQYWPFIDRGFLAPGGAQWDPTGITSLASDFLSALNTDGFTLCVNSRKNKTLEPVETLAMRFGYIGTQRRRSDRFVT